MGLGAVLGPTLRRLLPARAGSPPRPRPSARPARLASHWAWAAARETEPTGVGKRRRWPAAAAGSRPAGTARRRHHVFPQAAPTHLQVLPLAAGPGKTARDLSVCLCLSFSSASHSVAFPGSRGARPTLGSKRAAEPPGPSPVTPAGGRRSLPGSPSRLRANFCRSPPRPCSAPAPREPRALRVPPRNCPAAAARVAVRPAGTRGGG